MKKCTNKSIGGSNYKKKDFCKDCYPFYIKVLKEKQEDKKRYLEEKKKTSLGGIFRGNLNKSRLRDLRANIHRKRKNQ